VREAVERYGYSQREVAEYLAEYLGVHYSSVSRMLRKGND
jgi:transposase